MLYNAQDLEGFSLDAVDGEIGTVKDVFFDDHAWVVRYLVVDTGGWLSGRRVLIAPHSLGEPNWDKRRVPVSLNQRQVENSPAVESDSPVSRRQEEALHDHYQWPYYWHDVGYAGLPYGGMVGVTSASAVVPPVPQGDPHLRSLRAVRGMRIEALDGGIGHVEDVLINTHDWALRHLVVDTRNWLPSRKVLVAPAWIEDSSWADNHLHLALTREDIKNSPEWDEDEPVEEAYEALLQNHYHQRAVEESQGSRSH